MKSFSQFFTAVFLCFLGAWVLLVLVPYTQMGTLQPMMTEFKEIYPLPYSGVAKEGRRVYASYGCNQCHTQQIRSSESGSDIERGWGERRTIIEDYLYDDPPLLGRVRLGPDLINVAKRLGKEGRARYHLHLFSPTLVVETSAMPSYRFLYEKRKIYASGSADALILKGTPFEPEEGYEIVPSDEAKALVAYLMTLDHTYSLPKAPLPKAKDKK